MSAPPTGGRSTYPGQLPAQPAFDRCTWVVADTPPRRCRMDRNHAGNCDPVVEPTNARPAKVLSLSADVVPVVYRVTAFVDGEVIGEGTHTCLPGDVAAASDRVRAALASSGFDNPEISFRAL